jgi:hypothetical protein
VGADKEESYTLDRRRWVVGEVGIDGIKADTPYRCDAGRLEEAQS